MNMKVNIKISSILYVLILLSGCKPAGNPQEIRIYSDKPFVQDYSVKYKAPDENVKLYRIESDRNDYIQILSSEGLLRPADGQFLYPGRLVTDIHYRPTSDKEISGIGKYHDQLVYLDDKAVFSNAWAGKLYSNHKLPGARIFAGGEEFAFLVSDGEKLVLIKDSEIVWRGEYPDKIMDIKYYEAGNEFWILGKGTVSVFSPARKEVKTILEGDNFTCIGVASGKLIAGTSGGLLEIDLSTHMPEADFNRKLPWPELTVIKEINKELWFGSTGGAFRLRNNGKYDYYASERWLPSDDVIDISAGPEGSVLILTGKGLAKICFINMTLHDKAMMFEKQVRERHIRHGFNSTLGNIEGGEIASGSLEDSDNDGLWTSMYLAGQAFRHAVGGEEEALENIRNSLDAMERLFNINPVAGFPSRSFERRGYKYDDKAWQRAEHPEWDWKSTTSSDEAIGHIFAYGIVAELINMPDIRGKAVMLIDTLMSHILENDYYLVDWNGEPTTWGRWNPAYVNSLPEVVGDRKLNSSNIIGMLQTAFHFTGKVKYRDAAFRLMTEHGYLENLMRPMNFIGPAPADAGEWSRMLSEEWNHSDDEMYFCGYWGLYRYALNDTLKSRFREAILDHWQIEKPEKEGLWNIMIAMVEPLEPAINDAVWFLKEYPLDLTDWSIINSNRKDIEFIDSNFRNQTIREVLPPDELPVSRHNSNRFRLDGTGGGRSEYSAGDIWLLPYWMGRYLNVISGPGS